MKSINRQLFIVCLLFIAGLALGSPAAPLNAQSRSELLHCSENSGSPVRDTGFLSTNSARVICAGGDQVRVFVPSSGLGVPPGSVSATASCSNGAPPLASSPDLSRIYSCASSAIITLTISGGSSDDGGSDDGGTTPPSDGGNTGGSSTGDGGGPTVAQDPGTAIEVEDPVPRGSGELTVADTNITNTGIFQWLQNIVDFLTVGVAIVVTINVVYSGIQFIISRGDPAKTKEAVNRLSNAGIAIALFIFGVAILEWILPGTGLVGELLDTSGGAGSGAAAPIEETRREDIPSGVLE